MKPLLLPLLLLMACSSSTARSWEPVHAEFDSLAMLCEDCVNYLALPPDFNSWLRQMDSIATVSSSPAIKWRTMFWKAYYDRRLENHDKCVAKLDVALSLVDSVNYPYDYRRMKTLRWIVAERADKTKVFHNANDDLRFYTAHGDKLMMGQMNLNIGRAYAGFEMFPQALKFDSIGSALLREAGYIPASEKGAAWDMTLYARMGNKAKAEEIYRRLIGSEIFRQDTVALIALYNNGYTEQIDPDGIFHAHRLAHQFGDKKQMAITAINLTFYYLTTGRPQSALRAISKYRETGFDGMFEGYEIELGRLDALNQTYAALERWDSAYHYAQEFYALKDSLDILNNNPNFKTQYEKLAFQRETERLEQEKSSYRMRTLIILLTFSLIVVAALTLIRYLHIHRRLREAENRALRNTVQNNERELTTSSLLLVEKRKIIDHLNRQIDEGGRVGKIDNETARELKNFIKIHQGTEDSLAHFYDYFNQIHPDFFQSLKTEFPELTKGELRLCAYIRMGLDTKQIAQVLAIQPVAVKNARYRLRKKFRLQTSDSLDTFLAHRSIASPAPL